MESNVMNEMIKAGIHGGVMAIGGMDIAPKKANIIKLKGGYQVGILLAFFAIGVGNSFFVDFLHKQLRDQTDVSKKVLDQTDLLFSAFMGAIGVLGLLYLVSPGAFNTSGLLKSALLGAGSEVVSAYGSNIAIDLIKKNN